MQLEKLAIYEAPNMLSAAAVFLMADAVLAAKAGQKTPDCYYHMKRML